MEGSPIRSARPGTRPFCPSGRRVSQRESDADLARRHAPGKAASGSRRPLEEALVNAIKHGSKMAPAKRGFISYRIAAPRSEIPLRDEGAGFDPADVPDPTD